MCDHLDLDPFTNLCNFSQCVQFVKLMKTTRYAEWWEAIMDLKTKKKVLMKIFLNPQSVEPGDSTLAASLPKTVTQKLYGYVNEAEVYYNIIRPMLSFKICPHFYKPLGSAQYCSLADIVNIFHGNPRHPEQVKRASHVIAQVLFPGTEKPKINSLMPLSDDPVRNEKEFVLNPERYQFNTLSLEAPTTKLVTPEFHWEIVFQVAVTCYALQLAKVNHNNLLPRCVDVRLQDKTHKLYYLVNNNCYELQFAGKVYIKNFQKATTKASQFQPLKDLVTFLVNYAGRNERIVNELVDILVNPDVQSPLPDLLARERERTVYKQDVVSPFVPRRPPRDRGLRASTVPIKGGIRVEVNKHAELKKQFMMGITIHDNTWALMERYRFFNSLEDILFLLSQQCKKCTILKTLQDSQTVYTMHPDMFDENGYFNYVLNHNYAIRRFQSYIPTVQELDNLIEFTNQEIQKRKAHEEKKE